MENIFTTAAIWLGLAVLSTIIAYHLKISIALIEICIGVAAAAVANHFFGQNSTLLTNYGGFDSRAS